MERRAVLQHALAGIQPAVNIAVIPANAGIHGPLAGRLGMGPRMREGDMAYFSQPRWRKYRNGAIALVIIRPIANG